MNAPWIQHGRKLLFVFIAATSMACINVEDGVDIGSLPEPLQRRVCKDIEISQKADQLKTIVTPTRRLNSSQVPEFLDDMDFKNMLLAIDRQIKRFQERDLSKNIRFGTDTYKQEVLLDTIIEFRALTVSMLSCLKSATISFQRQECFQELNAQIRSKFNVYAPKLDSEDPRYGDAKDTFFTAYYSPTLETKARPDSEYRYPLFMRPRTESLARSTRGQIDFQGRISDRGYELYYANNLFDIYLLQVQGSGIAKLPDGEKQYMSYGGTNKQSWRWISKYMKAQGYIPDLSIYAQREFLDTNPHKHEEIYSTCPSYVYVRPTDHPPTGSDSVSVTNGRSIATDTAFYPRKGTLAFIQAMRPKEGQEKQDPRKKPIEFRPFSRFVLDQDTGGAIDGKARVDIYQGDDEYARQAAFNTQHTGNLFFLVLKK